MVATAPGAQALCTNNASPCVCSLRRLPHVILLFNFNDFGTFFQREQVRDPNFSLPPSAARCPRPTRCAAPCLPPTAPPRGRTSRT